MVATKHPDATAFAARFLAQPEDRLGRLVFADWLDEQGGESNTAWADYIRTQAELETMRWNDPALGELSERSANAARRVRAKLVLRAPWASRLPGLLKLLPANRCVLRFDDYWYDPSGRDWLPRSEADEHRLLPLYVAERNIFLATERPADVRLHERLTIIFEANVHLFGTLTPVTPEQIEEVYTCTGSVWGPLDPAWREVPTEQEAVGVLDTLLAEVITAGVRQVWITGDHTGGRAVFKAAGGWRRGDPLTADQLRLLLGGVRGKLGCEVIPTYPRSMEFDHPHEGGSYRVSSRLSSHGPLSLWIELSPLPAETLPGTGVAS